jgi:PII-like signaling protein
VVEIVDSAEKIEKLIPEIMELTKSCLITTEKVQVIRYGDGD